MPQHIRTARPSGDIRGFTGICAITAGMVEGQIYMIQNTVGVVFQDAAFGAAYSLNYHVEKIMVDKAAVAIFVGDAIYWSGVDGDPVTNVWTSGLLWIGICVEDAAAGADQVKIDLKGDKATVGAAP